MSEATRFVANAFEPGKNVISFRNTESNEAVIVRVSAIQHVEIDTEFLHVITMASHIEIPLEGIDSAGARAVGLHNTIFSMWR